MKSFFFYFIEFWVSVLDRGYKVGVLFIDFCKVFDCVDYIIFIEKFKVVGLVGDMWKWISDYFFNCMQGISVNKFRFDRNFIRVGVF